MVLLRSNNAMQIGTSMSQGLLIHNANVPLPLHSKLIGISLIRSHRLESLGTSVEGKCYVVYPLKLLFGRS